MAYDVDVAQERYAIEEGLRRRVNNTSVQARDLETIVTVLEVAALSLTTEPGATFTREHLIEEAHKLSGDEVDLQDEDIKIVLTKQGFLRRVGKELCMR